MIRLANAADIPVLSRHRRNMFEEMAALAGQSLPAPALDRMEADYTELLQESLGESVVGFVAEQGAAGIVASGALWFVRWLPHLRYPQGTMAYVHSVWTDGPYRGRGVATAIMRECITAAGAKGHNRVVLHASEAGRPIYEKLGFRPGKEMVLELPTDDTVPE